MTPTNNNNNIAQNKSSLVLKDKAGVGINFHICRKEVADNPEAINAAIAEGDVSVVASYLLKTEDVGNLIKYLKDFRRKSSEYSKYLDLFKGCLNNLAAIEALIEKLLTEQEAEFNKTAGEEDVMIYTLGGEMRLFIEDVKDDAEAAAVIIKAWEVECGPMKLWNIELLTKRDSFFATSSRDSASKFGLWVTRKYLMPVLADLGLE